MKVKKHSKNFARWERELAEVDTHAMPSLISQVGTKWCANRVKERG